MKHVKLRWQSKKCHPPSRGDTNAMNKDYEVALPALHVSDMGVFPSVVTLSASSMVTCIAFQ
jgi:hypothetical protein